MIIDWNESLPWNNLEKNITVLILNNSGKIRYMHEMIINRNGGEFKTHIIQKEQIYQSIYKY